MIGWRTKLAYGWGSLGNNIVYGFVATYLAVFYTEVIGIAAASASVLFLVVRVADAVLDPVMGLIVDRTSTRWGRFRPYLLFTPPVLAVLTVAAFSIPQLDSTATLVLAYLSYLLWGVSFTVMDVPYWSMSAALTLDARDRTSLVMVPRTLANIGFIGVNIVTLPLVTLFAADGPAQRGWQIVAALYAGTAVVLTWTTFFRVHERVEAPATQHYGLVEMGRLFAKNAPLQLILLAMLLTEVAFTVRSIVPVYYLTYNFDAAGMVPVFIGVFAVTTLVGSLLSPVLAKLWGKRSAAVVGIAVTTLASLGAWLTGYAALAPVLGWIAVAGLGYGVTNITLVSMLTDTVEYGQWRTGRRTEGLIFSSNIFKTKIASAIGASVALALLAAFGYVAGVQQSRATLDGLHLTMTVLPGVVGALAVVPLLWYRLGESRHAEIVQEIDQRDQRVAV
ncbi:glycoside-pentoside-hexuronide (GPH):cation symporter [Cellulomonas sp. P22]|uniref:glycoside-pentoside-hexuronide (GPH):cation symporter n=1 Tax=Cellulomonas sp. P22 TaxID=3373189 RepID=UPI0037C13160